MAYSFANTNGNIIISTLTANSTISTWHVIAFRNLPTGGNRIADKQNSGSVVEFIFSPGDGKFAYTRGWSDGNFEWRGGTFNNETVTRAIITYDGSSTSNAPIIYQASGGVVTATAMTLQSGTVSGTLNTNSDAYTIGNRQNSSANRPWSGWLAEIAKWNNWLSMEAIEDMLLRDKSPAWYPTNRVLYIDCVATVNDYDGSAPTVNGATENESAHPVLLRPAGYGGIVVSAGGDAKTTDSNNDGEESIALDGTVDTTGAKGSVTSNIWYLDYVDETNKGTQLSTSIDPTLNFDVGQHWITLRALSSKNIVTTSTIAITVRPQNWAAYSRQVIRHWFYNDALDGTAFSTIAANYDRLVSTAARESSLNTWWSAKSGQAPSERSPGQYILAAEARSATPKWENNVLHSGNPDSYAAHLAAYPEHYLRGDTSGTVLGDTNKKLDHGHPGVPGYVILNLDRTPSGGNYGLRTRDGGGAVSWAGANAFVFLDNVFQRWDHLGVSVIYDYLGRRRYLSTAEYVNGWERYLRLMYDEYGLDNGGPGLWGNIADLTSTNPDLIKSIWRRYSRYLDGYMHEAFAVGYDLETYSVAKQTLYVELVEQAIALDKYILCVAQTNNVDNNTRQRYALAVFMLVADKKYASFRYTSANNNGAGYTDYHTYRLYANEDLDLGEPEGGRYNTTGNWWRRDFLNGYSSALFGSASSCHIVEVGDNTFSYEQSESVSQALLITDYSTSALTLARQGGDNWPTGLSLSSGTLTGTVDSGATPGEYNVIVRSTDSDGGTFDFTVALTITQNNVAPVLTAIGNQTVAEGDSAEVNISATDENGGLLVFSIDGEPDFVSLLDNEDGTAVLTIAPDYDDAGTYPDITITVTDNGGLTDSEVISITVTDTNRAPVLTAIGAKTGYEGDPLQFNISATDPDGDAVSFTVDNLPAFGSFQDNEDGTGTFIFNPTFDDSGVYNITVTVTDDGAGNLTDFETFTLTIEEIGRAPVLSPIGNRSMRAEKILIIELSATDPDGDGLAFSAVFMPEFGTLDDHGNGTATLTFAPGTFEDDGGEYEITIIVTDDSLEENTDQETFTLTVLEPVTGAAGDTPIPLAPVVAEPFALSHTINDLNEDDIMARYIPQCYASAAGNLSTTAQSLVQLGFSADQVAQATTCVISIAGQDILYRTAPDAAVPVISPQTGIHVAADTGVPVIINANAGPSSDIARLRLIALTGTARWTIQLYG